MGTDRVEDVARALSREEFARRYPGWFLIVTDTGEDEPPSSFETVADGSATPHAFLAAKSSVEAHEIAKAPGNPYPDRISVGRARNCDVVLRHASVSKLHARFSPRPDGHLDLVDVGSQVGTRVNGRVLEPNKAERVGPGFVILFGRVLTRVADGRTMWDMLKMQQRLDESALGPTSAPRSAAPASAPRASAPGAEPRGSSPGPAPPSGKLPPSGSPPRGR